MQSPDNEFLVETSISNQENALFDNTVFNAFDQCESLNPIKEGNVNGAMDLFAPDQSSSSNSLSKTPLSSTLDPAAITSFSEPKHTSDTDRSAQIVSNYQALLNEHDYQDSLSVESDSNFGDCKKEMYSPINSPSTPTQLSQRNLASPHFPSSNITFPSKLRPNEVSKTWTTFNGDKENKIPSATKKLVPVRPPPSIPKRKTVQPNIPLLPALAASPNCIDLMDLESEKGNSSSGDCDNSLVKIKPVIPPRQKLFSTTKIVSEDESLPETCDQDRNLISSEMCGPKSLIEPSPPNNLLFSNLPCNNAPPIPPRRMESVSSNACSNGTFEADFVTAFPEQRTLVSSSPVQTVPSPFWVNFNENGVTTAPSDFFSDDVIIAQENQLEILDVASKQSSEIEPREEEPAVHWTEPSSSPDIRSSSTKKKGGQMGYLCLENDDCDNSSSTENINLDLTPGDSLSKNDKSPKKPLSQWATFQNEEDEEENPHLIKLITNITQGNLSLNSSCCTDSIHDDPDLEDDFGPGCNRLSVELPDLKGFNRADKGSQNNLVDFSDDRGSAATNTGSQDNVNDEDVETIFDLTAQGDSLKRRRRKDKDENKTEVCEESTRPTVETVYHIGPAGLEESLEDLENSQELFNNSSKLLVAPENRKNSSQSSHCSRTHTPQQDSLFSMNDSDLITSTTNPFWFSVSATTASEGSLQESLLDSPFDKVVFKNVPNFELTNLSKVTDTTSHVQTTNCSSSSLIRIPPPPSSLLRSSARGKRSSVAKESLKESSHVSMLKRLDLDSSSEASDIDGFSVQRSHTPGLKSSNVESAFDQSSDDVFDFVLKDNEAISELNQCPPINDVSFDWIEKVRESAETDSSTTPREGQGSIEVDGQPLQDLSLFIIPSVVKPDFDNNTNLCSDVVESNHSHEMTSPGNNLADNLDKLLVIDSIDPLLELQQTTSVESPNEPSEVTLPRQDVELIQMKRSWDVYMRFPREKRAMSNRKWVQIHIKLDCDEISNPLVKLYYTSEVKDPFHTVSLACHQMQLSKPKLQAHYSDEGQVLGKLHAVKLMVVQYKEKQTFSPRRSLSRNPCGFKHACKGKQSIKFGFTSHYDVIMFWKLAHDAMFDLHKRQTKLQEEEHVATVKYHSRDELMIDACDELQALVNKFGVIEACSVRVHLFACSFLSGDPMARLTVNDKKMSGKEVVRREDIIPTTMERWIDVIDPELHESCTQASYSDKHPGMCEFYPPDACKFELMRFSTTYPEEELPVTVKTSVTVKGARLQLRCVILMSSKNTANKDPLTQISCEDVMIRFPVPDEWGIFFRVDGKFRNHSVRAKRAAKQRCSPTGTGVIMEASVGVAKYEFAYQAIVWRLPRLPEKNTVQNTPHVFTCQMELRSDQDLTQLVTSADDSDEMEQRNTDLDDHYKWCEVEFTTPGSTASNICVRSISLPNTDRAEKFVCYQSHYFYKVQMNLAAEAAGADGSEDIGMSLCAVQ